jgi:hypothetical protein
MKTLHKNTVLFLLAFIFTTISFAQIIVVNKLETPASHIHNNSNRTQIWISGEWVASNSQYIWKEGAWVDKKPGYIFLPGYWKQVKGGWTWVSGSWKSISMEQWNNIYA